MGHIEQSRTRVITVSVIGIFVTGTLIGLASALPNYFSSKRKLAQFNAMHVESIAGTVDSQMSRYLDIARQTASRSEIRKRLELYANGALDYAAVTDYSSPRLGEAFRKLPDLVAALRLGPAQEVIFSTRPDTPIQPRQGNPLQLLPSPDGLAETSHWLLQARTSISTPDGQQTIGSDVLYFAASGLNHQLSLSHQFGTEAQLYLLDRRSDQLLASDGDFLHARGLPDALAQKLADNAGGKAKRLYYQGEQGSQVVFYRPLTTFDGALILALPERVLYAPALKDLFAIGLLTLLMMLIAALLTRHALKPLMGRIITQSKALEESNAELRMAASVFENTQEAIVLTDRDLNILRINKAFSDILGYGPDEVTGKSLSALFEPEYRDQHTLEALSEHLARDNAWQGEVWYQRPDNIKVPALQTISAVRDESALIVSLIHIFNDISEHKASERRIKRLAEYDSLTGLANRSTLLQSTSAALLEAKAKNAPLAALFLDLDKFKPVNDTLGHHIGDEVLKAVAGRIANSVRKNDLIGRLGGDEFLVLLKGPHVREDAGIVAQKLIEQLSLPFQIEEHKIEVGASVGIAFFPDDADSSEKLISLADKAMYSAKHAGGMTFRYVDTD
ncbi:diguanylate cyclase domain-containing protein [Marinobacterium sp. YM272]|uniref:diguanylate cyclase domain-containing protein n=1 Tax=Marinobacterium sp. YM272 TaxID=3421654 RepID=UPI003D7FE9C2